MNSRISLNEAATYLGVTKTTLRNWDKSGKLKADRNPLNAYRTYDMDTLRVLKEQIDPGADSLGGSGRFAGSATNTVDSATTRRLLARLQDVIRDNDVTSNIIERFDEISKLLFLRLKVGRKVLEPDFGEDDEAYAMRIRSLYHQAADTAEITIPDRFATLNLNTPALTQCAQILSNLTLETCDGDLRGRAYEEVIRGTFDKNDNQQFFTPHQIVDFMVNLSRSYLHGNICDPACGTAGFLAKVTEIISGGVPRTQISKIPHLKLFGMEVDERLAWVARMNLYMHEGNDFEVVCLPEHGTLGPEAHSYFGMMDVILTNPPFGSSYADPEILDTFELGFAHSSRRRGILFVEQIRNLLKPHGVAAVVLEQSILNSSSTKDVREFILSNFQILAVIDLPESAFMPYATVNTSIMLLKKEESPDNSRVFYSKADKVGRRANGEEDVVYSNNGESRLNSDLNRILDQWTRFNESTGGFREGGSFSANVSESFDDEMRLDYLFHHPFRRESLERVEECGYKMPMLSELCEERNESYVPKADPTITNILFTGLADIEPGNGKAVQMVTPAASIKSAVKRYEPGDIVFSKMRPALRKVAVMHGEQGGYVSSECIVLTVRKNAEKKDIIDPEVLCAILRSDFVYGQIMSYVTGIGRPRIGLKDIRRIRVPMPDPDRQSKAAASLQASCSAVQQLREKATLLLEQAQSIEKASTENVVNMMLGDTHE